MREAGASLMANSPSHSWSGCASGFTLAMRLMNRTARPVGISSAGGNDRLAAEHVESASAG